MLTKLNVAQSSVCVVFARCKSSVVCDDGYIDCGPLVSSRRKTSDSEQHETSPLLPKSLSTSEHASVDDLTDGAAPMMYRCLSRSFSVSSQLSAAASSTIHEESCNNLHLAENEYLPMSGTSTVKTEGSIPASAVSSQLIQQPSATDKFLGRTLPSSDVSPKLAASSVSRRSSLSSQDTDSATVVPSVMSASYRNARDESGYLLFQPTGVASTTDGGSLERLGPPPEIPAVSASDYITPRLPPRQHAAGQRTHSLMLNSRPRAPPTRRRGSADGWSSTPGSLGPTVPPRDNRNSASSGVPVRPASERQASRKPNLTVDAVGSASRSLAGEFVISFVEKYCLYILLLALLIALTRSLRSQCFLGAIPG